MAKFQGTLWLADQVASKLSVEVDIRDEGTVAITARDLTIGEWPCSQLIVAPASDGIHIIADGEELVFESSTPGFVAAFSGGRPLRPIPASESLTTTEKPPASAPIAAPGQPPGQWTSLEPRGPTPAVAPVAAPSQGHAKRPRAWVRPGNRPGLPLAAAALVLAVMATVFGLFPDRAIVAVASGITAVTVGVLASRKREWWEAALVKGLATTGIALGIVAITLGVMGLDGVNDVLDTVASDIGGIVDGVGSETRPLQNVVLQLQECSSNGATGMVINGESRAVDVLIGASFFDEAGLQVASGTEVLNEVRPGTQQPWQVTTGGADYAHCRAEIQNASPS